MPFSEVQKKQFIELLQTKGWQLRDGTIWSPGGGLWFSDSHFGDWSPSQMHEIFDQRAERIAKAQLGDWQKSSHENREASFAAQQVTGL
ncbi:MAG TPA: hypothetical protein VL486_03920 [Verrucomicrobiae bacterium]|nr:hypothetical protein [Verrucomicrobiae bacterium]